MGKHEGRKKEVHEGNEKRFVVEAMVVSCWWVVSVKEGVTRMLGSLHRQWNESGTFRRCKLW